MSDNSIKGLLELIIERLLSPGELTIEIPLAVVIATPEIYCKKLCLKATSEFAVKGVAVEDLIQME